MKKYDIKDAPLFVHGAPFWGIVCPDHCGETKVERYLFRQSRR